MQHKILIYGGLGNVASERIIPSLNALSSSLNIEYAIVDIRDDHNGKYFRYGSEPLQDYNSAVIATPNNTHAMIALKALKSGLNILCEKPLADTKESAEKIVVASENHPRLTSMLCDHYIYKPSVRYVLSNWESCQKVLGKILKVDAVVFENELRQGREHMLLREISGGGVAMDTGFHLVFIMGKLFGFSSLTVEKTRMTRFPQAPGDEETYAVLTLRAGEIPINIEVGKWMGDIKKRIIFTGSKSILDANIESGQVLTDNKEVFPVTRDDCYPTLLKEFLSAIETKRTPYSTIEEGYQTLSIIKRAYDINKFLIN